MQDNERQAARVVQCLNCGAPNPAEAAYCAACGSSLPESDSPEEATVIDVSSGQPRVLAEEPPVVGPFGSGRIQGGFTTVRLDQGRVIVSQGSRRNCLLIAVVGLLLACCACWFLWSIPGRIF